jgi:hypothetical protein
MSRKNKDKKIRIKDGNRPRRGRIFLTILKISIIICLFAGAGVLVCFADKYYIQDKLLAKSGPVVLANAPQWVDEQLKEKITAAAGRQDILLNEQAAHIVAKNLASVAWLDKIRTRTTNESIQVQAEFRKPIAYIRLGQSEFYLDSQRVVLDYTPIPNLTIVEITGLTDVKKAPPPGQPFKRDDLAAAITIIDRLNRMDNAVTPSKPLLNQIASIDISNYNGRRDRRKPHIVLFTSDNTRIEWGAAFGAWQKYLESTDEQKLAKLYGYYKEHGSLASGAKYIVLWDPQDKVPLPIDKY